MSIQVAIHHATRYRYDRAVQLGAQTVRLRPAPHCRTKILNYNLTVEPAEAISSTGSRIPNPTGWRGSWCRKRPIIFPSRWI